MALEKLFQPIRIGGMEVRNRIVYPPCGTKLCEGEGFVTERQKDYYEAIARGGAGLVIVEVACVSRAEGRTSETQFTLDDDKYIPGVAGLAGVIKKHGARAAIQLHHAGREARTDVQPVAPSVIPITASRFGEPRALSTDEIAALVTRFADAAERAAKAGFDAVELHGASGYLIAQFISPDTNRRQDAYGGDVSRRARFLVEIIRAIKKRLGQDYPVWSRLNVREFGIEGGATLEDMLQTAQIVQDAGADAIHLSAWGVSSHAYAPVPFIKGAYLPLIEQFKKVAREPLIAVGRITPEMGEMMLRENKADMIAIGRGIIADPELPAKAASGHIEDIRPCIACNNCISEGKFRGERVWGSSPSQGIRCSVNPAAGQNRAFEISPAPRQQRVVVVGGGPAGLEAARVAALRGHQVTLFERQSALGGMLRLVALSPSRDGISDLINYLSAQVAKVGVDVRLNTEATAVAVQLLAPDVLIVAAGAEPLVPDIPGIKAASVVTSVDVMTGKAQTGSRVVIVGGQWECDVAEFLVDRGKAVTVTKDGPRMAAGIGTILRRALLDRLAAKGVTLVPGVKWEGITQDGLVITDIEGKQRSISADTVVISAGGRPRDQLFAAFQGKIALLHRIGDCVEPRGIMAAIREGATAGRL